MMLIEPRIKIHNDYVRESSINAELEGRSADVLLRLSFSLFPTVLPFCYSPFSCIITQLESRSNRPDRLPYTSSMITVSPICFDIHKAHVALQVVRTSQIKSNLR